MTTKLLYLFTRTPLHVGAGASVGAIDQPVQRERHTGFPVIPGSSVKGVLRDHIFPGAKEGGHPEADQCFGKGSSGKDASAGHISFGEARLVAFPVRSAKGAFALAVSPLTLSRLNRDAGWGLAIPEMPADMTCRAGAKLVIDRSGAKGVVLEEYAFKQTEDFPKDWEEKLTGLLSDSVLASAAGRFVLLSDGDLSHFAVNACQVNQHVRINDETGTADDKALFNEETVPSETLFYAAFTALRKESATNAVFDALQSEQLVQFGGDGTTGLGFCSVKLA
ncbi:MAG: type III-B CRISPR module RAMP protein Cmr4 [Chthoniobacterales bacterium]|nr:type III-B CRISPR module RAMP protein Cmr4 [Chthoniobacterales bacterium]